MNIEYILFNYDVDEPIFASDDRGLLEEILYDIFFEDAYFDFCWRVRDENLQTINSLLVAADECWNNCFYFYEDYIDIVEVSKI